MGLDKADVKNAWDNKGDIVIGSDAWICYEALEMAEVTIDDGVVIASRSAVTKRYTVLWVGFLPER